MTDQLQDLVRATLAEHAKTVTAGPQWHGTSPRERRWPAVVAAAASVVLIAGVAVLWRADQRSAPVAGGASGLSCSATLPASWRAALKARPITVDGHVTEVDGVLRDGSAVIWESGPDHRNHIVRVTRTDAVTPLFALPSGGFSAESDFREPYAVLSIAVPRKRVGKVEWIEGTTDIVVVDVHRQHIRHLLPGAPRGLRPAAARGSVANNAVSNAVVQGNTVYWTVHTAARAGSAGVVVGFNLVTGRYRRVGTYHSGGGITRDARGVWWPGGSIAAPHVPGAAPSLGGETSFRSFGDHLVYTDGGDFAWADTARRSVHWVGKNGRTRTFRLTQVPADDRGYPLILNVAGPYVLLIASQQHPSYRVLDTRSGALADTRLQPGGSAFALGPTLYVAYGVSRNGHDENPRTVRIDTSQLPALRC